MIDHWHYCLPRNASHITLVLHRHLEPRIKSVTSTSSINGHLHDTINLNEPFSNHFRWIDIYTDRLELRNSDPTAPSVMTKININDPELLNKVTAWAT